MLRKLAVATTMALGATALVVAPSPGSGRQETTCFGSAPTVTGSGDIVGTPGDDVILGSDAVDHIRGFTGNDKICGGAGDDRIGGGPGNDEIDGGPGNDEIDGGQGSDRILGGEGDDLIRCGTEDDVADGGPGTNIAVTSGFETCETVTNVTAGPGPVAPAPKRLDVKLTVGQQVPRPKGVKPSATGRFTATLTPTETGGTLIWRLTYSRLTGRATAAVEGRAVMQTVVTGGSYLDVHTKRNPNGEIRGQIPSVT